jgi:hypothetical protein
VLSLAQFLIVLVLLFTYLPITGKETHGFAHALRGGRGPFPFFIEAVKITHFRGQGGFKEKQKEEINE